ncbi:MAG: PilZ domain-containing protein [Terriglobia bacterium]
MSDPNGAERRTAQRFSISLPLEISMASGGKSAAEASLTRDVSFRGVYFSFERELEVGSPIDLVLTLPKELTLSVEIRVRCQGRVVRVDRVPGEGASLRGPEGPIGVAAQIEQYEFLPSPAPSTNP